MTTLYSLNSFLKNEGEVIIFKFSEKLCCRFFGNTNRLDFLFLFPFTKGKKKLLKFMNTKGKFALKYSDGKFIGILTRSCQISPRRLEEIYVQIEDTSIRAILRRIGELEIF